MRLPAFNVKGLGDKEKSTNLVNYLKDKKVDLALLTESHLTEARAKGLRQIYPSLGIISNAPSSNSVGVTWINLSPHKIPLEKLEVILQDTEGRALGIKCYIEGSQKAITLLGIYAPNGETAKVRSFKEAASWAGASNPAQAFDIVLGNWNAVLEPEDRNPHRSEDPRVTKALLEVMEPGLLIDGWREAHLKTMEYTYTTSGNAKASSQIDRILCKAHIYKQTEQWKIEQTPG